MRYEARRRNCGKSLASRISNVYMKLRNQSFHKAANLIRSVQFLTTTNRAPACSGHGCYLRAATIERKNYEEEEF